MKNITYELIRTRQKMYIKAYAVLCLVLLLVMGFYTYKNWNDYTLYNQALNSNDDFVQALKEKVAESKTNYDDVRNEYSDLNSQIAANVSVVFPTKDNYTALTRQIDAFEEEISTKNNLFEISNLEFQPVVDGENYRTLPLMMNIRSSANNFTKFLHLVENSGSLEDKIRLMDISSIRLNFEESIEEGNKEQIINFSVQMNAYFQK